MPNGAPGDHPITDILIHGLSVYSPDIDRLIVDTVRLGGRDRIERKLFLEYNPYGTPDLARLEAELTELVDELRKDAKERGWEVELGMALRSPASPLHD